MPVARPPGPSVLPVAGDPRLKAGLQAPSWPGCTVGRREAGVTRSLMCWAL